MKDNPDVIASPVLHIAAETIIERLFRKKFEKTPEDYRTADLFQPADIKLNIEDMSGIEDGAFGSVICNHVLEHVDDAKALREIHRILRRGGHLLSSVPLIDGWEHTYENPDIVDPQERELHFGQFDHLRMYGRDFIDRLRAPGFSVEEITAEGEAVVKYGLLRGDKFFICTRND
jgi:SAM-dependent methyltransferase